MELNPYDQGNLFPFLSIAAVSSKRVEKGDVISLDEPYYSNWYGAGYEILASTGWSQAQSAASDLTPHNLEDLPELQEFLLARAAGIVITGFQKENSRKAA